MIWLSFLSDFKGAFKALSDWRLLLAVFLILTSFFGYRKYSGLNQQIQQLTEQSVIKDEQNQKLTKATTELTAALEASKKEAEIQRQTKRLDQSVVKKDNTNQKKIETQTDATQQKIESVAATDKPISDFMKEALIGIKGNQK
jgi:C4-dicarboxylate-specific signal transduction histidine kinase